MSQFRIRFHLVGGGDDKPSNDLATDWVAFRDLPFVPRVGDTVQIGKDDDYRVVEAVHYTAGPQLDLCVFLEDDMNCSTATIVSQGWEVDVGQAHAPEPIRVVTVSHQVSHDLPASLFCISSVCQPTTTDIAPQFDEPYTGCEIDSTGTPRCPTCSCQLSPVPF